MPCTEFQNKNRKRIRKTKCQKMSLYIATYIRCRGVVGMEKKRSRRKQRSEGSWPSLVSLQCCTHTYVRTYMYMHTASMRQSEHIKHGVCEGEEKGFSIIIGRLFVNELGEREAAMPQVNMVGGIRERREGLERGARGQGGEREERRDMHILSHYSRLGTQCKQVMCI